MRHNPATITAVALVLTLTAATACTSDSDELAQSPLAEYIDTGNTHIELGLPTTGAAQTAASENSPQNAIAECMAGHGYDYQPTGPRQAPDPTGTDPDPNSRDYATTWGYGITTHAFSQELVGENLLGYTPDTDNQAGNPNIEHINNLDPDHRADYIETLTGEPPESPDQPVTASDITPGPDTGGCQGETASTARGDDLHAFYEAFADDLATLRRQILNDPELVAHHDTAARCVEEQGVDYTPAHDLYQRWATELTAIAEEITHPTPDNADSTPHLSATGKARLNVIQNDETTLATTTYDCGADPATTTEIYTRVTHQHEQRYITTHRDQLDEYNRTHS